MIFVDTNVLMYAVGGPHEVRDEVRQRLASAAPGTMATSAEVMQELLHRYLPTERWLPLDAAFRLVDDRLRVWDVRPTDVRLARRLADRHRALTARDLVHLATCVNRNVEEIWTYDRGLAGAWVAR